LIVSFVHFRETTPAAPRLVRFSIPPPEKESVVRPAVIVSPDGRSVAFYTRAASVDLWYDRQGKPSASVWTPGPYNEMALSPDATRVTVVRNSNPVETWVFEFTRGASTRLTPSGGTQPTWSPDGSRIVYRSGVIQLFLMAASGAGNEANLLKM